MLLFQNFLTAAADTASDVVEAAGEAAAGAVEAVGEVAGEAASVSVDAMELTADQLNEMFANQVPQVSAITPVAIGVLVVYAALCIGLVVVILSQKKRSANPGGSTGIGGTYWDKNKGRSAEGKMELITKWGICAFMSLAFIISLNLIK